ncbi:MAG TPA: sugar phosphate isomerase/epimerase [Actinomycetales bacterium]|nr:sugar phosphate isomerase/epimerase [Actinomycetales bacterium]
MTRPALSVQLYTLRDRLSDLPALARDLARIGFECVEPHRWYENPGEVQEALSAAGLRAPSAHAPILDGAAHQIFAAAAELGVETVIQPSSDPELWRSSAGVEELADRLNQLVDTARDFGVKVGYHNHAFEFLEPEWVAREGCEGELTALDYFAQQLRDEVTLEVDTYWAAVGGADPVALLRRLGERVTLLHIKDGPITSGASDQVAVGAGAMPVEKILAIAPHARPVIELDDHRGDMLEAVRASFEFLVGRV